MLNQGSRGKALASVFSSRREGLCSGVGVVCVPGSSSLEGLRWLRPLWLRPPCWGGEGTTSHCPTYLPHSHHHNHTDTHAQSHTFRDTPSTDVESSLLSPPPPLPLCVTYLRASASPCGRWSLLLRCPPSQHSVPSSSSLLSLSLPLLSCLLLCWPLPPTHAPLPRPPRPPLAVAVGP